MLAAVVGGHAAEDLAAGRLGECGDRLRRGRAEDFAGFRAALGADDRRVSPRRDGDAAARA